MNMPLLQLDSLESSTYCTSTQRCYLGDEQRTRKDSLDESGIDSNHSGSVSAEDISPVEVKVKQAEQVEREIEAQETFRQRQNSRRSRKGAVEPLTPPPKPPRLQNFYPHCSTPTSLRRVKHSPQQPQNAAFQRDSLATSTLTEVTQVLREEIMYRRCPQKPQRSQTIRRRSLSAQIKQVLRHARDFLLYELEPDRLVPLLVGRGLLSRDQWQEHNKADLVTREEAMLDLLQAQTYQDFLALCDCVRLDKPRLADLLYVLDQLMWIVAKHGLNESSCDVTQNGAGSPDLCSQCSETSSTSALSDESSFTIDIFYVDTESGELVAKEDVLDIKRNKTRAQEDRSVIVPAGKENTSKFLPVLSASIYNHCLAGKVSRLVSVLQNHSVLRELILSKNHLSDHDLSVILHSARGNIALQRLDLRLNVVETESVRSLEELLHFNTQLHALSLTGLNICDAIGTRIVNSLKDNQFITNLDISFNALGLLFGHAVHDMLISSAVLRVLKLRNCNLNKRGLQRLVYALRKNKRLVQLDLSKNYLGEETVSLLAETLLTNCSLRQLELEDCGVGVSGCAAFARALKTNTTLSELNLSMNRDVADKGVSELSHGIIYNKTLRILSLNMCRVSNDGFLSLLQALQFNITMVTLKLCYNNIGASSKDNIRESSYQMESLYGNLCDVLQSNKQLRVLLWGNRWDLGSCEVDL